MRIQNGMVALDLTKPIDYQSARFAEVVGAVWTEVAAAVAVCAGIVLLTGPAAVPPTRPRPRCSRSACWPSCR